MTAEMKDRIRHLRKVRKFSVAGIARQTGLTEQQIAKVLKEPHLLAQISRQTGKSRMVAG